MKIFEILFDLFLVFIVAILAIYFLLCAILAPTMIEKVLFIVLFIIAIVGVGTLILLLESEVEK